MARMRLQKAIAHMGITSRRKAEQLIVNGKVFVNGTCVSELGAQADPEVDVITVEGISPLDSAQEPLVYIMLNKPVDIISSASSTQGTSVLDLLTKEHCINKQPRTVAERVYPVGRLDKDSEGLVLLTNDGDLTQELTHPSFEHQKEYEVTIDKRLSKDAINMLESGMSIGEQVVQGIQIQDISNRGKRTIVTVVLQEGKHRQIRKMFGRLGYHVSSLKRTRIANLSLGTMPIGSWKYIQKSDIM